ncbi:unnamed protein product, partial [Amoebophrya sp. A25]
SCTTSACGAPTFCAGHQERSHNLAYLHNAAVAGHVEGQFEGRGGHPQYDTNRNKKEPPVPGASTTTNKRKPSRYGSRDDVFVDVVNRPRAGTTSRYDDVEVSEVVPYTGGRSTTGTTNPPIIEFLPTHETTGQEQRQQGLYRTTVSGELAIEVEETIDISKEKEPPQQQHSTPRDHGVRRLAVATRFLDCEVFFSKENTPTSNTNSSTPSNSNGTPFPQHESLQLFNPFRKNTTAAATSCSAITCTKETTTSCAVTLRKPGQLLQRTFATSSLCRPGVHPGVAAVLGPPKIESGSISYKSYKRKKEQAIAEYYQKLHAAAEQVEAEKRRRAQLTNPQNVFFQHGTHSAAAYFYKGGLPEGPSPSASSTAVPTSEEEDGGNDNSFSHHEYSNRYRNSKTGSSLNFCSGAGGASSINRNYGVNNASGIANSSFNEINTSSGPRAEDYYASLGETVVDPRREDRSAQVHRENSERLRLGGPSRTESFCFVPAVSHDLEGRPRQGISSASQQQHLPQGQQGLSVSLSQQGLQGGVIGVHQSPQQHQVVHHPALVLDLSTATHEHQQLLNNISSSAVEQDFDLPRLLLLQQERLLQERLTLIKQKNVRDQLLAQAQAAQTEAERHSILAVTHQTFNMQHHAGGGGPGNFQTGGASSSRAAQLQQQQQMYQRQQQLLAGATSRYADPAAVQYEMAQRQALLAQQQQLQHTAALQRQALAHQQAQQQALAAQQQRHLAQQRALVAQPRNQLPPPDGHHQTGGHQAGSHQQIEIDG